MSLTFELPPCCNWYGGLKPLRLVWTYEMYSEFKSPAQEVNREAYDWSRATERAIDLAISSGLLFAPRRVLLGMTAELKRQAEEAAKAEEMEADSGLTTTRARFPQETFA